MAASLPTRLARGSEGTFHDVTVELIRQYVCCLQMERSDPAGLSLATCAAALINRSRMMITAITTAVTTP